MFWQKNRNLSNHQLYKTFTMKHYLFLVFLLFLFNQSFSQKEANTWYFGRNAGLDFSGGTPKVLKNGAMSAQEGSAVISDRISGELFFYSNGVNVWNRNHQMMPKGAAASSLNPL
jgi:hypothetical protein